MKLGAIYYPTEDNNGKEVPFRSLMLPYIYKEIEFDGVYVDILNGRQDMTILDVGANIGIVTNHMRPHAKKIYSIEPSPEHFEALKMNKEYNGWDNVEVFNMALADTDGEMEIAQNEFNRTMNTLIVDTSKPTPNGHELNERVSLAPGTIGKGYVNGGKVKTMAFDTFLEENNIDKVDFCKFDVEGAEDLILRSDGFKRIADRVKAIEIEFHFPTWRLLVDYMISLGYTARQYPCSAIVILFTRP